MPVLPSPPDLEPAAAGPASYDRPAPRWPVLLLRIIAVLTMLSVFAQSLLAGRFLSGDFDALAMHKDNGILGGLLALIQIAAAVLAVRVAKLPADVIAPSVIAFVAVAGEIALGFSRVLALHIPLGALLLVGVFRINQLSWRKNASVA